MLESFAITTRSQTEVSRALSRSDAVVAPEVGCAPKRDRRRRLTKFDKRTALGRRIGELEGLFLAATPSAELSPLRRLKVGEAAQLTALAERARGILMREGEMPGASLDDIVRLERRAASAVKALGLRDSPPPPPTLSDILRGGA